MDFYYMTEELFDKGCYRLLIQFVKANWVAVEKLSPGCKEIVENMVAVSQQRIKQAA